MTWPCEKWKARVKLFIQEGGKWNWCRMLTTPPHSVSSATLFNNSRWSSGWRTELFYISIQSNQVSMPSWKCHTSSSHVHSTSTLIHSPSFAINETDPESISFNQSAIWIYCRSLAECLSSKRSFMRLYQKHGHSLVVWYLNPFFGSPTDWIYRSCSSRWWRG